MFCLPVLIIFLKIVQIIGDTVTFYNFIFEDNDKTPTLNSECVTSIGSAGQCIRLLDCPAERIRFTNEDICYFETKYPVVCCENRPNIVNNTNVIDLINNKNVFNTNATNEKLTQNRPTLRQRIYKKCEEYHDYEEGGGNKTRRRDWFAFVAGNLSLPRANPQMETIGWKVWNTIDWKCGGSLISENFIITAAHCAYSRGDPANVVRVGGLNLLKDNDTDSQQFEVVQIFVHPNYNPRFMYHDIALMKISPNAKITSSVRPACLWTDPEVYVNTLKAMGYGTDAFAGRRTNELYEGELAVVTNDDCRAALGTNVQIPNGITKNQICAKDPNGKADTCQGDSGGPLMYENGFSNMPYRFVVGVTSFGESCAGLTPGVYTRVSSYLEWIEQIVWPNAS